MVAALTKPLRAVPLAAAVTGTLATTRSTLVSRMKALKSRRFHKTRLRDIAEARRHVPTPHAVLKELTAVFFKTGSLVAVLSPMECAVLMGQDVAQVDTSAT